MKNLNFEICFIDHMTESKLYKYPYAFDDIRYAYISISLLTHHKATLTVEDEKASTYNVNAEILKAHLDL